MVAHKRSLYPMCSFLRMLAVEHGLAQCDVESHLLSVERKPSAESWILHRVCSMLECLKTCTFAVFGSCNFWIPFAFSVPFLKDGQESVEVSFRWAISPLASMKSHVFKPNAPDSTSQEVVKTATLGGYFQGNFQKVPRNTKASLVWEAGCWSLNVFLHVITAV